MKAVMMTDIEGCAGVVSFFEQSYPDGKYYEAAKRLLTAEVNAAICGAFAGLAGATQVLGVYHRLIPAIALGYGYLGLMVGMLVNYQALWAAPVAFFFAALNIGSIQLPIVLKLDSSLSGIIQGALVLTTLLVYSLRTTGSRRKDQGAESRLQV